MKPTCKNLNKKNLINVRVPWQMKHKVQILRFYLMELQTYNQTLS